EVLEPGVLGARQLAGVRLARPARAAVALVDGRPATGRPTARRAARRATTGRLAARRAVLATARRVAVAAARVAAARVAAARRAGLAAVSVARAHRRPVDGGGAVLAGRAVVARTTVLRGARPA